MRLFSKVHLDVSLNPLGVEALWLAAFDKQDGLRWEEYVGWSGSEPLAWYSQSVLKCCTCWLASRASMTTMLIIW